MMACAKVAVKISSGGETSDGKNIPMNPMTGGDSEAVAHWATCTEQDSFRK